MNTLHVRLAGVTAGAAAAVAAVSALLIAVGLGPMESLGTLADGATWRSGQADAAVRPVLALAAWGCVLWLAFGLVLATVAALPSALGQMADTLAERITPAGLRRIGRLALGVTLATAGLAATALPSSAETVRGAQTVAAADWGDLDWPGTAAPTPAAPTPAPPPAPPVAPGPPTSTPSTPTPPAAASPSPTASSALRQSSLAALGTQAGRPQTPAAADADQADEVVVLRGDTLWDLAARQLDPAATEEQIAAGWHAWYAANRSVIGADPDLILPGQRLVAPAAGATS